MSYIDPLLFNAIKKGDISKLMTYKDVSLLRPILPILTQFILENHLDESIDWEVTRNTFYIYLKSCKEVKGISAKFGVDFSKLSKIAKELLDSSLKESKINSEQSVDDSDSEIDDEDKFSIDDDDSSDDGEQTEQEEEVEEEEMEQEDDEEKDDEMEVDYVEEDDIDAIMIDDSFTDDISGSPTKDNVIYVKRRDNKIEKYRTDTGVVEIGATASYWKRRDKRNNFLENLYGYEKGEFDRIKTDDIPSLDSISYSEDDSPQSPKSSASDSADNMSDKTEQEVETTPPTDNPPEVIEIKDESENDNFNFDDEDEINEGDVVEYNEEIKEKSNQSDESKVDEPDAQPKEDVESFNSAEDSDVIEIASSSDDSEENNSDVAAQDNAPDDPLTDSGDNNEDDDDLSSDSFGYTDSDMDTDCSDNHTHSDPDDDEYRVDFSTSEDEVTTPKTMDECCEELDDDILAMIDNADVEREDEASNQLKEFGYLKGEVKMLKISKAAIDDYEDDSDADGDDDEDDFGRKISMGKKKVYFHFSKDKKVRVIDESYRKRDSFKKKELDEKKLMLDTKKDDSFEYKEYEEEKKEEKMFVEKIGKFDLDEKFLKFNLNEVIATRKNEKQIFTDQIELYYNRFSRCRSKELKKLTLKDDEYLKFRYPKKSRNRLLMLKGSKRKVYVDIECTEAERQDAAHIMRKHKRIANRKWGFSKNAEISCSILDKYELLDVEAQFTFIMNALLDTRKKLSYMDDLKKQNFIVENEIFSYQLYFNEISDSICILQNQIPDLMKLEDFGEVLLCLPNGDKYLAAVVANNPSSLLIVGKSLIENSLEVDCVNTSLRYSTLYYLSDMNPLHSFRLREMCIEKAKCCNLVVKITIDRSLDSTSEMNDVSLYVSNLLLRGDSERKKFFNRFMHDDGATNREFQRKLREFFCDDLMSIIEKKDTNASIAYCDYIRLYSAMKSITNIQFTNGEVKLLLSLVTQRPDLTTEGGNQYLCLALCMLVITPEIIKPEGHEKIVIEWIKWMIDSLKNFKGKSFGEMLLLIAIHFQSGHLNSIVDLTSETLGTKVDVKLTRLNRIKNIFVTDIFTEKVIAKHASNVPITPNLNNEVKGYLSIHCIYQLVNSGIFAKSRVHIKHWILKQIVNTTTPIHDMVPKLINSYIESCIIPYSKMVPANRKIKESDLKTIFTECHASISSQCVLVYYVLLYEDRLNKKYKEIGVDRCAAKYYSQSLLSLLPIKLLMQHIRRNQYLYAGIYAPLVNLLVSNFPYLCLVNDSIDYLEFFHSFKADDLRGQENEIDTSHCDILTIDQLEILNSMPTEKLIPHLDAVVRSLSQIIAEDEDWQYSNLLREIWSRLNTIVPRKLCIMTINRLNSKDNSLFSENDCSLNPLICLRLNKMVYRRGQSLEIVIRTLESYLSSSRCHYMRCINKENEGHVNTLLAVQNSTVVQILLEYCLDNEEISYGNLREMRGIIFTFIHQLFIDEPILIKLIHFQGYPLELIPLAIQGIPSLHICSDFVPEMISQPDLNKQIFAIQLVSYLCKQYKIPKILTCASLAVNTMSTLQTVLSEEKRTEFFIQTLPALVRIVSHFPTFSEPCVRLIFDISKINRSVISIKTNIPVDGIDNCKDYIKRDKNIKLKQVLFESMTKLTDLNAARIE